MPRKYPTTTNRVVAYFDVMGFKDLVYRSDHAAVSKVMSHVSRVVKNIKQAEQDILRNRKNGSATYRKGVVLPVLFSDSILFVSRTDSVWDARKTVYAASFFLYAMFDGAIPVKGALAYGRFTANFKNSEFFGRPLIDAFLLGEETQFYGAALHHSFESYLHSIELEMPEDLVKHKALPMKGGSVMHSYIDWQVHLKGRRKSTNDVFTAFSRNVSGSTRRYVDNSRLVYNDSTSTHGPGVDPKR